MKKTILFSLVATFLTIQLHAQNKAPGRIYEAGQADIQVGVGLVSTFFKDDTKTVLIPLSFSADYLISQGFSLGLQAGHSVTDGPEEVFSDGLIGQWRNTYTEIGLRMAGHYNKMKNLDLYGGICIGASHSGVEALRPGLEAVELHKGIEPNSWNLLYSAFLGSRYSATDRWSAFGEIGFGVSLVKVGIGYRLF
ncbi:MAG: hypothetical protein KDC44_01200 [Phaeodactylibacter sp.]|nr:hypothetical protein [Phaeodactylibacter sp.]